MRDLELAALAHRQLGPVTRRQALAQLSGKVDDDRRRGNALALAGWTVLSFTSASDKGEMAATAVAAYERAARAFPPLAGTSRGRRDGVPPR